MRISDWSSDVCSSDLQGDDGMGDAFAAREEKAGPLLGVVLAHPSLQIDVANRQIKGLDQCGIACCDAVLPEGQFPIEDAVVDSVGVRSEEHTSELQSLMRISYAVFCLKKKTKITNESQLII